MEPVIRDADRRANELLQNKWRKLLAGAAKARFGFAGAGFLDPKLLAKAVQETFETDFLALLEDRGVLSMSETAQFVFRCTLTARRLAVQRDTA